MTPQDMLPHSVKDAYMTQSHITSSWEIQVLLPGPPNTTSLVAIQPLLKTTVMWDVKRTKFTDMESREQVKGSR